MNKRRRWKAKARRLDRAARLRAMDSLADTLRSITREVKWMSDTLRFTTSVQDKFREGRIPLTASRLVS
jgi:hypothetical protein